MEKEMVNQLEDNLLHSILKSFNEYEFNIRSMRIKKGLKKRKDKQNFKKIVKDLEGLDDYMLIDKDGDECIKSLDIDKNDNEFECYEKWWKYYNSDYGWSEEDLKYELLEWIKKLQNIRNDLKKLELC